VGGGGGRGKQPEIYGIHYQRPEAETSWRPGTKTRGNEAATGNDSHEESSFFPPWGRRENSRKAREVTPTGLWLTESQVGMEAV